MKRIYYYFEFKKLLEKYELTYFVMFILKQRGKSFFTFFMNGNHPKRWFNDLVANKDQLDCYAFCYSTLDFKSTVKRFNQAKDRWTKFVAY